MPLRLTVTNYANLAFGAPVFAATPTLSLNMLNGYLTAAKFITSGGTSGQYVRGDGSLTTATYLTDAPSDGTTYGRKNGTWTAAGGVSFTEITDTVVAAAFTTDWSLGAVHYVQLTNGVNTCTLSNPVAGGKYILIVKQPASGAAGTITFSPTVPSWNGAIAPTLTTTNGKIDVFTFLYSAAAGVYLSGINQNY